MHKQCQIVVTGVSQVASPLASMRPVAYTPEKIIADLPSEEMPNGFSARRRAYRNAPEQRPLVAYERYVIIVWTLREC
jgi:hypothetical protein